MFPIVVGACEEIAAAHYKTSAYESPMFGVGWLWCASVQPTVKRSWRDNAARLRKYSLVVESVQGDCKLP